jgi:hypothetical protein
MNAWLFFLGTDSYSNSGLRLITPIETLWVLLSDGIVALRGISKVLVEPILLFTTLNMKIIEKIKWKKAVKIIFYALIRYLYIFIVI